MTNNLKIRFFGTGILNYKLSVSDSWIEKTLLHNKISINYFLENIFLEDFFLQTSIYHPTSNLLCTKFDELFGEPTIRGIMLKEVGFFEIKWNLKRIFRGSLNSILSENLLFPMFNIEYSTINCDNEKAIKLNCKIISKGLIGNFRINSKKFEIDDLIFKLTSPEADFNHFMLTNAKYDTVSLKWLKGDSIVISQRCWIE